MMPRMDQPRYCQKLARFLCSSLLFSFLFFLSPLHAEPKAGDAVVELSEEAIALKSQLRKFRAKSQRGWLKKFYESRNYEPAWNRNNGDTEVLVALFNDAVSEALDPTDYRVDEIGQATGLQRELLLSDALLRYASHVQDGVYKPRSVDGKWYIRKPASTIVESLQYALENGQLDRFLKRLPPQNPVYSGLREQLQHHRQLAANGGWPKFPKSGPKKFEPGARHQQIQQLRERLAVTDGASAALDPLLYDDALVETVKRFQRRHGLNDDGVIGWRTRSALAVPIEHRIRQIEISMERWRWLPRDLGSTHVLVDVPAYRLWFHQPNRKPLTMRVIVGTYKNQTPSFTQNMRYLVMNPNWYVPNSIASKELAPKVDKDPDYINRAGFKVYDKATNTEVDASTIDWSQTGLGDDFPYKMVQSAGRGNALGTIKFMFPNRHGIYLHDTSSPHLFKKDTRAFSHGCVRIAKPMDLASRILGDKNPDQVREMISKSSKNRHINLSEQIPVYLVYMTAWSDNGEALFFDDIYKRDRGLLSGRARKR